MSLENDSVKFAGLVNYGYNGYVNCVVHLLYMIPEFKKQILQLNVDPSKHSAAVSLENNTAYQLQKLFVEMDKEKSGASIETMDLLKSFGWEAAEIYKLGDCSEFFGILLERLEQVVKDFDKKCATANSDVYELFNGKVESFIRTKNIEDVENGTPIQRGIREEFIRIPCALKNIKDLESSIEQFLDVEVLDGEEQVYFDELGKKADALKGTRITEVPYLLCFDMNRYTLDYNTMSMIKLSHKVEFPFALDVSQFVEHQNESLWYEICSIVIHEGSTSDGQNYSFVKDVQSKKWFKFADKHVDEVNEDQVKEISFGKKVLFGRSKCATLLFYRLKDDKKNLHSNDFGELYPTYFSKN